MCLNTDPLLAFTGRTGHIFHSVKNMARALPQLCIPVVELKAPIWGPLAVHSLPNLASHR
jgi:hypothetical protein